MSKRVVLDDQVIRDLLFRNYEALQADGNHPLTPPVLERAFQQVKAYVRKHRETAENVHETEVRLHSQEMKTKGGTSFMIEGVVDLVRDGEKTIMYDLKTQSAEQVKGREAQYRGQLNVYAWLWECSKDLQLDAFGVLALGFTKEMLRAIARKDEDAFEVEFLAWETEIRYPIDMGSVAGTVDAFKKTIDSIESHRFEPPTLEKLKSKKAGDIYNFATQYCANCDVRFSCKPYQEYIKASGGKRFKEDSEFWGKKADSEELEQWLVEHVDSIPDVVEPPAVPRVKVAPTKKPLGERPRQAQKEAPSVAAKKKVIWPPRMIGR